MTKTNYIGQLNSEIQRAIMVTLTGKGLEQKDVETAMNSRLCDLEDTLNTHDKEHIFEAWLNYEGLAGDTAEFLKAVINKDPSTLCDIVNNEDTKTLEKYYNLSEVLKKNTRYSFYIMWLEYEGITSYEHEIVEVMELLDLVKREDLYKKIA